MRFIHGVFACIALAGATSAWSQPSSGAAVPQNVLQLSASGTAEVQQDLLTVVLAATREGNDAAAVQAQLKSALDAGLIEARKSAQPGQLDVHTGSFNLNPRYSRDGKINGWQGTAELVLEGRDVARVAQTAGRVNGLTISRVGFGLSREQRLKAETEAQVSAIGSFKQKALDLAKGFGFSGYTLREIGVSSSDGGVQPRFMALAERSKVGSFSSDAAVPVEPGKTNVVITVSGSVQLK